MTRTHGMGQDDIANNSRAGQSWQAIFAFALIGTIFLLWITIIAIQVFYDK